jgi:hypothetical protein
MNLIAEGSSPAPLFASIHINSIEEFQTMFAKHGAEIMADIPNYTNVEPAIQSDEVLME